MPRHAHANRWHVGDLLRRVPAWTQIRRLWVYTIVGVGIYRGLRIRRRDGCGPGRCSHRGRGIRSKCRREVARAATGATGLCAPTTGDEVAGWVRMVEGWVHIRWQAGYIGLKAGCTAAPRSPRSPSSLPLAMTWCMLIPLPARAPPSGGVGGAVGKSPASSSFETLSDTDLPCGLPEPSAGYTASAGHHSFLEG